MRKCVVMFTVLVVLLIVAMYTNQDGKSNFDKNRLGNEQFVENTMNELSEESVLTSKN
ncbi:hypothetical protein Q4603_11810 [Zobellia galactanivorans]|nr:hypothetical protein [Zobellia galactanivorans]MBU3026553.1 hypothetical protein [Zobellia galactanivorans]MDO6809305.1 hypothetical protein [Zobellia galactanivorans]